MTAYFRDAVQETKRHPREGLIHSLLSAEIEGDRLTEEEVVANTIITMVAGRRQHKSDREWCAHPVTASRQMRKLRGDLSLTASAVEEMLRFESRASTRRGWLPVIVH